MSYKDHKDQQACWRRWYHRNRAAEKTRRRARRQTRREWKQNLMASLKCARCPENHPSTLEFHHRDPALKDFTVSRMLGYAIETIKREMDKCDVLCANCHRKEHHRLRQQG